MFFMIILFIASTYANLPPTHHFIKEGWHIVNEDFFCFLSTQWYSFLQLNWDDFQVRWNPPLFYTTGSGDLNLIPYNLTNTFCGEVITLKINFISEIVALTMKVVYNKKKSFKTFNWEYGLAQIPHTIPKVRVNASFEKKMLDLLPSDMVKNNL